MVGTVYSLFSWRNAPATLLPQGLLERLVPFDPSGIWVYLSFFLLVPLTFYLVPLRATRRLCRAMQYSALVSGLLFWLYPSTLHYPRATGGDLASRVWRLLHDADSGQNCLPSLHGALTVICVCALLQCGPRWRRLLALLWGLAIAWSVLQTRRHLGVDLLAGMVLGLCCSRIADGHVAMVKPLLAGR